MVRQKGSLELEKRYQISVNGKRGGEFNRVLGCLFGGKQKVQ